MKILFIYSEIYSAVMSFASLLIGIVMTCWIYFQTNQYMRNREAKDKYIDLCNHIVAFKTMMGEFGALDVWKNKAAIETYYHHSNVTKCHDARKETVQDNPFLKLYLCCRCFNDGTNKKRKSDTRLTITELNKFSAGLSKILNPDVWDDVKDKDVWNELSEESRQWLAFEYPELAKNGRFDKDVAYAISKNIVAYIVPHARDAKERMDAVWPLNLKPVMWLTLVLFMVSFIGPAIVLCMEYSSFWTCVGMIAITSALAFIIVVLMVRMFVHEVKS